ncbi:MAG: ABC transporter ATP-binding protein [Candidatus Margulisiibacteriota bacterium]
MNLYSPISSILSSSFQIQTSLAAAGRIFALFDAFPVNNENRDGVFIDKIPKEIKFSGVSFKYDQNGKTILDDINVNFEPGKLIGIIGPNGSGKSTLWHLLFRYYEPDAGIISIGNTDIKGINLKSLRKYISFVPQNEFLFNTTIIDNILMGRDIDESGLEKILGESCLKEMLSDLPLGLNTVVGETGMKLSGGQKQRIMLARALVNDPMVLIMDEGLSQLDPTVENNLISNFKYMAKAGKTIIIISHKQSLLEHFDKIIVIKDGKILNRDIP